MGNIFISLIGQVVNEPYTHVCISMVWFARVLKKNIYTNPFSIGWWPPLVIMVIVPLQRVLLYCMTSFSHTYQNDHFFNQIDDLGRFFYFVSNRFFLDWLIYPLFSFFFSLFVFLIALKPCCLSWILLNQKEKNLILNDWLVSYSLVGWLAINLRLFIHRWWWWS